MKVDARWITGALQVGYSVLQVHYSALRVDYQCLCDWCSACHVGLAHTVNEQRQGQGQGQGLCGQCQGHAAYLGNQGLLYLQSHAEHLVMAREAKAAEHKIHSIALIYTT